MSTEEKIRLCQEGINEDGVIQVLNHDKIRLLQSTTQISYQYKEGEFIQVIGQELQEQLDKLDYFINCRIDQIKTHFQL